MPSRYTLRIASPPRCIEARCAEHVQWNGRGRPPKRCPKHREERARWIKVRSSRRAHAIAAGRLERASAICIAVGCEAAVEDTQRANGGRAPERCAKHRAEHRTRMRKLHRSLGPKPASATTLLPAPQGPGRGSVQRERAAMVKAKAQTNATAKQRKPQQRCACTKLIRGVQALQSLQCRECRQRSERKAIIRPMCACSTALRARKSHEEGKCWACRKRAERAKIVAKNAAKTAARTAAKAAAQAVAKATARAAAKEAARAATQRRASKMSKTAQITKRASKLSNKTKPGGQAQRKRAKKSPYSTRAPTETPAPDRTRRDVKTMLAQAQEASAGAIADAAKTRSGTNGRGTSKGTPKQTTEPRRERNAKQQIEDLLEKRALRRLVDQKLLVA